MYIHSCLILKFYKVKVPGVKNTTQMEFSPRATVDFIKVCLPYFDKVYAVIYPSFSFVLE